MTVVMVVTRVVTAPCRLDLVAIDYSGARDSDKQGHGQDHGQEAEVEVRINILFLIFRQLATESS